LRSQLASQVEIEAADPDVVHARGGDGQTPLHFASTVEVAEFLLANGAEIDARDVDHESTPAQYMLRVEQKRHYPRDRQDVARYLVARGCRTDILMAAALGDADLVRRHLDADAGCIRLSKRPDAAKTLSEADHRKLPNAAQKHKSSPTDAGGGLASRCAGRDGSDGAALGCLQRQCGDDSRDFAVPPNPGIEIAGV
jgi:hypothetical protein